MKGIFISFEGIDGAGKSTQLNYLKEFIEAQGYTVVCTREPGGTLFGERIRTILLDKNEIDLSAHTELLLVLASRREHWLKKIEPALQRGEVVISDRYNDATRAYQGYAGQIPLQDIEQMLHLAGCAQDPDLTFYLDVKPEESVKRRQRENDRFEQKGEVYLSKVREGYLELVDRYADRICAIDSHRGIAAVSEEIKESVRNVFALRSR